MKNLFKHIGLVLPILLLSAIILVIPQLDMRELVLPTQSGKTFGFLWGMLGYVVVVIIIGTIMNEARPIRITLIDLLSGAYCLLVGISYWLHPTDKLQMLGFGALILFYVSVRTIRIKYLKFLLFAMVISGAVQAIYGNLQLWGYYPSNHGIFRMTGSFFNPGPFAGYLCAILPVAVSIYFKGLNNCWLEDLNVRRFDCLIVRKFDRFSNSEASNVQTVEAVQSSNLFQPAIPFRPKTAGAFMDILSRTFSSFYCLLLQTFRSSGANLQAGEASNISNAKPSISVASHILKGIALITIIAIVLVLPASRSRAAWLGALAGCLFVFQTIIRHKTDLTSEASSIQTYFFKLLKSFNQLNLLQKRGLMVVGILISVLLLVGIYKFKQGSADGRLLIWKVSAEMIKDKPIFGHGTNKFAADYMNYQATYFKPNPDSPEAMQADNVSYAYNEFLKLTIENGLIGLLLGLSVIGCLFFGKSGKGGKSAEGRRQKLKNPIVLAAQGGLLSILVFALFSYPSDILPIKMLFLLFAAIVASHQSPVKLFQLPTRKSAFAGKVVWYSALAIVLIAVYPASQYLTRQYQAYKFWKDASDIYNAGAYPECIKDFELAYPHLKTNGTFLVQYSKALEMAGKPENSIAILNQAKAHLNNTILYTCLGNNYKTLMQNTEAEQAYLQAFNMAPARFYPLYLLAKLYNETGQPEKAVAMAKKVLEKEVKIESKAVEEIKEEMRKIIEKSEAAILNRSNTHTDNNLATVYKGTKERAYRYVVLTAQFMLQKW